MKCANPSCTTSKPTGTNTNLLRCARCQSCHYCSRTCQSTHWPSHKSKCIRPNYIIKFHLFPSEITDPPVIRTLSCPSNATFYMLHMALQTAFGWSSYHSFDFTVGDPSYARADSIAAEVRRLLSRQKSSPLDITKQMNPADSSREYLLRVTDPVRAFGQAPQGSAATYGIDQMHEGQRRHPRTVEKDSQDTKLWQVLDGDKYRGEGKTMIYTYGFGDNWEHVMTIEGRGTKPTRDFVCLSGEGHGVAEDVGSAAGWEALKKAYRAAKPTEEQKEKMAWYESEASNGDVKGLAGERVNFFDLEKVNKMLVSETMFERFERMADEKIADEERLRRGDRMRQGAVSDMEQKIKELWRD
ncbi:hypothetical protein QBC43DRAFT_208158 [Cladorrhinum sp. PSN259]|nr:hypothetical protein QBC43DRAFT_208158 [Cladorrhinum sp. PSN259]